MSRSVYALTHKKVIFSYSCTSKLLRIVSSFLVLYFFCQPVLALELDTSIDDEIRKNYNPSKLEEDVGLPPLPKNINEKGGQQASLRAKTTGATTEKSQAKKNISATPYQQTSCQFKSAESNCITLKKGTKVNVKLLSNISDSSRKGTKVKFVSTYPVSTTYFTIPMGTYFYGQISNSHKPQLSGNGGLIEINITSVVIDGEVQPINAYITKANCKNIFFNNIKGKRKYLSSTVKSTSNGRHFFVKMLRLTGSLATDGSSIIVAPFSLCAGILTLGGNIIMAPVLGFFHKGDSIAINGGSEFEIKLSQDVFLYN